MRVLQCVNYFYPSVGGTQFATHYLAKGLKRLGVDIKIVTFNVNPTVRQLRNGLYSAHLPRYEEIDGLPVYRFPVVFLGKVSGSKPRYKIMVSPSATRMILREKPDVIHFQGANEVLQATMTSYASIFSKSKTVLTVHGVYEQVELFRKRAFLKHANELLLKLAFRGVDHIIALSRLDLGVMSHLGISHEKVSIIPNGVDLARFQNASKDIPPLEQELDIDIPFVLCVTRIRENKGIESLIRAARSVVSERPDVKFVVVGNCPETYAAKLHQIVKEAKLEENFIFAGHLPETHLLKLYRYASVFVLPSLMETLPLVLLEAMAAKLPIVASRVGGIPDLITPSDGILTPPGDAAELSSSLLYLLNNDNVRTKLRENAGRKAKNYSWDKIAQRTLSLYEELLA